MGGENVDDPIERTRMKAARRSTRLRVARSKERVRWNEIQIGSEIERGFKNEAAVKSGVF